MMTIQQASTREANLILRIQSVLEAHAQLSPYHLGLDVTMEGPRVVLRGVLPSAALKQALVPAIRQAGVLGQVCNCVEVA
ncbi:hypothetical protein [Stieleria varia]|uniref:BON domain protein n=1 Tax=Stieleria varia TaxID=2528005 RepID=A0A5C6AH91_9BACT|nr:hypothetical protein [Stieleria varia]TWT98431.1 hypothetical protein Pla52n_49450 [Stieleria varia]